MLTPLRSRITGTTNGSTAVEVKLPQIKPGQLARVRHLALSNQSGESVTLRFGLITMGSFTPIWAKQTVADADAFGALVDLILLEGDVLAAEVTGSAKSSTVIFIASGELHTNQPEIVEVIQAPAGANQNA